jgi:hypothetical protein
MTHQRLEGVLLRNRKHIFLDVALAALFPLALLLSGLAVGSQLPKLSAAPRMAPVAAPVATTAPAAADNSPV